MNSKNINTDGSCKPGFIPCGGDDGSDSYSFRQCVSGALCPVQRIVVRDTYSNTTSLYENAGSLTSGANNNLYYTRLGNNGPLSQLLASSGSVCRNSNDFSYWGSTKESEWLRGSSGLALTFGCSGGPDLSFDSIVMEVSYQKVRVQVA